MLGERASESLLDSYESERSPHVRSLIDLAVALGRVICVPDAEQAADRDRRMIAEARERKAPVPAQLPPLGPGCFQPRDPAAGRLFVQDRVRRGAALGLFDDVVGRGWALVSPLGDPAARLDPELAAFFASIGGVGAHVAADGPIEDVGGGYARWFGEHGAAVALQRPDFHVFGTAPALDGAAALVAALRERLA